jgi:hypothetical protein
VAAWSSAPAEQVIDGDVQCRGEGVEVGAHEGLQQVDDVDATPTLDALNPRRHQPAKTASLI